MRYAWIAIPLLLSACVSEQQAETGKEFTLPVGDSISVGAHRLTFEKVLEDSRCPMNARCVWEGNARILLGMTGTDPSGQPAQTRPIELNTSERFATRAEFANGFVRLVQLDPTPMTGEKVTAYTALLVVDPK